MRCLGKCGQVLLLESLRSLRIACPSAEDEAFFFCDFFFEANLNAFRFLLESLSTLIAASLFLPDFSLFFFPFGGGVKKNCVQVLNSEFAQVS